MKVAATLLTTLAIGVGTGVLGALAEPSEALLGSYIVITVAMLRYFWYFGWPVLSTILIYLGYGFPVLLIWLFSDAEMRGLQGVIFLFLTGFVGLTTGLAIGLGRRSPKHEEPRLRALRSKSMSIPAGAVYLVTGAYFMSLTLRPFGSLTALVSMGRAVAYSGAFRGTSVYGVAVMFATASLILFAQLYPRHKVLAWASVGVPALFWLVTGNRSEPVYMALGATIVLWYRGWRPDWLQWILLVLSAFVVVGPIGQARLVWHKGIESVIESFSWSWFDLSRSELATGVSIARMLFEHGFSDWRYGTTYLQAIVNALPSFLQPVEFERPALWYLKTYLPEYYAAGLGAGFSPVVEAYVNFGLAGPLFIMCLVGLGLGRFLHWSRERDLLFGNWLEVITLANFLNFNRIDFVGWLTRYLFALVCLVCVYGLSTLLFSPLTRLKNLSRDAKIGLDQL